MFENRYLLIFSVFSGGAGQKNKFLLPIKFWILFIKIFFSHNSIQSNLQYDCLDSTLQIGMYLKKNIAFS